MAPLNPLARRSHSSPLQLPIAPTPLHWAGSCSEPRARNRAGIPPRCHDVRERPMGSTYVAGSLTRPNPPRVPGSPWDRDDSAQARRLWSLDERSGAEACYALMAEVFSSASTTSISGPRRLFRASGHESRHAPRLSPTRVAEGQARVRSDSPRSDPSSDPKSVNRPSNGLAGPVRTLSVRRRAGDGERGLVRRPAELAPAPRLNAGVLLAGLRRPGVVVVRRVGGQLPSELLGVEPTRTRYSVAPLTADHCSVTTEPATLAVRFVGTHDDCGGRLRLRRPSSAWTKDRSGKSPLSRSHHTPR